MLHAISLQTSEREQMIDITCKLHKILEQEKINKGLMIIYSPHTTAGIAITENADPAVCHDILKRLSELCPKEFSGDRHVEGNSAAHLKACLVGTSKTVIIDRGELVLGRWQGVYFCEFDGPRPRTVMVKVITG